MTKQAVSPKATIKAHMAESFISNAELSLNVSARIITTTEDKLRLAVLTHLAKMGRKLEWIAPAGIFITVLGAFVTADFKEKWLPAETWAAVFFLVGLASFVWFIIALIRALNTPTLDNFVDILCPPMQTPTPPKPAGDG